MKKVLAMLALSLAALPSLAEESVYQTLNITGFRIGSSAILGNAGRIVATNLTQTQVWTNFIRVGNNKLSSNAWFSASVPAGQEVIKWLAYNSDPTRPLVLPTQTNQFAGAVTQYVWRYNANDTADKYIVVDYDYINYTLKYDGNGSTSGSMSSKTYIYTNQFNLAANQFSKTGYTFGGWTNKTGTTFANKQSVSGSSFGVTYTNTTTRTANLYAKWKPNKYTVTLDPGFNTATTNEVTATYDSPWPVLAVPVRNGYRFLGWYNAASGGSLIDTNATYKTAANTTNYAHWVEQVTATFKDGHTGGTLKSETLDKGGTPTAPGAPEHAGYYATGWKPAVGAISVNTTFTMEYAQYTYTVVFHAGNGTDATATQQFTYNDSATSLNPVSSLTGFSLTGYNFQNWTNSTGTVFSDGQQVSNLAQSGEYHLYAVWSPILYTIAFDGNGADSGSVASIAATYDQAYELPANGFVKAGRSFKAWRLGLDGDTYNVGESVSNLTTIAKATVTFYAIWSEPRYIAFDGNGANNAAAMADDTMTFDGIETKTLVSNKFEKTGHTFDGWATNAMNAAALMTNYVDGAEVVSTNLWMAIGETNVFYAVWQTNAYTVAFNASSGMGEMDDQEFFYDQSKPLSKCNFSSNLKFSGWATNQTGAVVFDDEAIVSNLTAEANGEVALYAVWDNGELSKAMHCDNLYWTQTSGGPAPVWAIVEGENEGYNPSGSCVSNTVSWSVDRNQSQRLKSSSASSPTAHKLSFWYKTSSNDTDSWLTFSSGSSEQQIAATTTWTQYDAGEVNDINSVEIYFNCSLNSEDDAYTVWIDQMKWEPAGSEPTEEDKPTISAFMATANGFTLSVDPSNISDSFSYQILATNELVVGDWPVKTNLTAEAVKARFDIVPEAGEPTMFYKVKVIAK